MKKSPYWTQMEESRAVCSAPPLKLTANLFRSYRHFICFAKPLIDKIAAWFAPLPQTDVAYYELNDIRKEQGVVLLGSHFGNIEALR